MYKLKCQFSQNCKYLVKSVSKKCQGSGSRITGKCYQGHHFTIMETQPEIKKIYSGNVMLAASILFSGLNFQKVQ